MLGSNLSYNQQSSAGLIYIIVITTVLQIADSQLIPIKCRTSFDCSGTPVSTTIEECCSHLVDPPGLAFTEDGAEGCSPCPIVFGFFQTSLVGLEQRERYNVKVGYLSGSLGHVASFKVEVILGTASPEDVSLVNSIITMFPNQVTPGTISFTLRMDNLAQEIDETFSIVLTPTQALDNSFGNISLMDQLNVTIIDVNEVAFSISEEDYVESEMVDASFSITVSRNAVSLANPVTLQITPLTISDALTRGVISEPASDNPLSPRRATYEDFDESVLTITFPADKNTSSTLEIISNVLIIDDVINEAQQRFVVHLEIVNATNFALARNDQLNISTCIIIDNDDIRIGFEFPVYNFSEPNLAVNITDTIFLIKENGIATEQTFSVIVTVRNTTKMSGEAALLPATIEDNLSTFYDYSLGIGGQTSVILILLPSLLSVPFTFILNSDSITEGSEFFQVTSSSNDGFPLFMPPVNSSRTALISILDNDETVIGFLNESIAVNEDAGQVSIEIGIISGFLQRNLSVQLSLSDVTAIYNADYSGNRVSVLSLDSSTRSISVLIDVINDDILETVETLTAKLTIPVQPGLQVTLDPCTAEITILDDDDSVVIGDPLFEVPLALSIEQIKILKTTKLSLCYEVYGDSGKWFNLITDNCVSANGYYASNGPTQNVIKKIGVRAVDNDGHCVTMDVSVDRCAASVNDASLNLLERYSSGGVNVRRYSNRVRISVPNCNKLTLVMWVICEHDKLNQPGDMLKFVVHRDLNMVQRKAHGLVGQFWTSVSITPYTGKIRSGKKAVNRYVVEISTSKQPRRFTGYIYPLDWQDEKNMCLYVGDGQGGPMYEVSNPNDGVIEGSYKDYVVEGAFSEDNYVFGLFQEERCV